MKVCRLVMNKHHKHYFCPKCGDFTVYTPYNGRISCYECPWSIEAHGQPVLDIIMRFTVQDE